MNIEHQNTTSKGSFSIKKESEVLAEMTYSKAGDHLIIIDHTEVSDALRGTGSGKKLVLAAVEFARANQVKIIPLCPFAKSVFEKTKEIQDVLN